jgi:hypothetical protein
VAVATVASMEHGVPLCGSSTSSTTVSSDSTSASLATGTFTSNDVCEVVSWTSWSTGV